VAVILALDAERQADHERDRNPNEEVEVAGERQV
jgi:hypothetical protein